MPRKNRQLSAKPRTSYGALASCTKKHRYPNKLAANRVAELKNLENSSIEISTYHCSNCHGWHLTSRKN